MLSFNFAPFPELITERLLLRKLTLDDAPAVMKQRSNEETMKYINRPLTKTIEDAENWIRLILDTLEKNDGITWAISLKDEPQTLRGSIGFWRIIKENYRAEIGYMLDPALHGKGIMYEAIQPILQYGFNVMHLHSVEGHIDPLNIASGKLMEKAHFVKEAHFKDHCFYNGRFADTAVYSLLAPVKND